jgi:23S rRNA pseudouridine1911/1915/1917 synthase
MPGHRRPLSAQLADFVDVSLRQDDADAQPLRGTDATQATCNCLGSCMMPLAMPVRLYDHAKAHLVVVPIRAIGDLIKAGALTINGRPGRIADLVRPEDVVTVDDAAARAVALVPRAVPLHVHYEDADLVIVDKPAGMHIHPIGPDRDATLLNALLWYCGARPDMPWARWRPAPLHRLDRAASGLVAFAKVGSAHEAVRMQLAVGTFERRYVAVVHGTVAADSGTIDAPLGRDPAFDYRRAIVPVSRGGKRAVTHWTVEARSGDRTQLELVLETGRTHQIRAHLASIGHPIVGDTLYGQAPAASRDAATEIALHASVLALQPPSNGTRIRCESPPRWRWLSRDR